MNQIKEILNKYLTPEQIELCAMEAKSDDWGWLDKHGYVEKEYRQEQGYKISCGHNLTEKGKEYIKKYNQRFEEIFDMYTQEDWRKMDKGKDELRLLERTLPGNEWKKQIDGLTKEERWAVRNLTALTW